MEFTKHLVVSLEATEIQSWLASDSDPAIDLTDDVERSRRRIPKTVIRKIYAKLIIQMIVTFIIVAVVSRQKGPLEHIFGADNLHAKVVTLYYFFSILILLTLVPYRHKFPWNYLFLFAMTIGSSLTTSTAIKECEFQVQLGAIYATIGIALALTLYAFNTHIDYTVCGAVLYQGLCLGFIGGMVSMAPFSSKPLLPIIHSFYGVFLFAFFIVYDTQIMLGGKHFVRIDPSRHNFITINIYVNMQMMFYYHLHLFSFYYNAPQSASFRLQSNNSNCGK